MGYYNSIGFGKINMSIVILPNFHFLMPSHSVTSSTRKRQASQKNPHCQAIIDVSDRSEKSQQNKGGKRERPKNQAAKPEEAGCAGNQKAPSTKEEEEEEEEAGNENPGNWKPLRQHPS